MPDHDAHDSSAPTNECVACREPIRTGARLCPHCGSSQRPEKIRLFGSALKWIGGVTAVISLVIGSASVYELYESWTERRAAVDELVAAAQIQLASQDYGGSWLLLDQALELEPASRAARAMQIPLAMQWVRNVHVPSNQSFASVVDPLLAVMYRGVSDEQASAAANVYAHIGWANYLKRRAGNRQIEIDAHFDEALRRDPENVYANAFSAHWMLNSDNPAAGDAAVRDEAWRRFDQALASGVNTGFVVRWLFGAISNLPDKDAAPKALSYANRFRQEGVSLPLRSTGELIRFFRPIVSYDQAFSEAGLARLVTYLPANELRDLFAWLRGELDDADIKNDTGYRYIAARLDEAAGDADAAMAAYEALLRDGGAGSDFNEKLVVPAIARVRAGGG